MPLASVETNHGASDFFGLLLLDDIGEGLRHVCLSLRQLLLLGEVLLRRHHPVDNLEVHDGLERAEHSIAADDLRLMNQQLVIPARRLILGFLDRREVLQVHVDVGEVVRFGLRFLVKLQHDCEAFLAQDFNRVDGSVEDGNFILSPLLRLELGLIINHALLI